MVSVVGCIEYRLRPLTLGHVNLIVFCTVACTGAVVVTATVVPSAVPSEPASAASFTLCTAVSKSSIGALTEVPSDAVPSVAIVMVNVSAASKRARRRRAAQGLENEMSGISTWY